MPGETACPMVRFETPKKAVGISIPPPKIFGYLPPVRVKNNRKVAFAYLANRKPANDNNVTTKINIQEPEFGS